MILLFALTWTLMSCEEPVRELIAENILRISPSQVNFDQLNAGENEARLTISLTNYHASPLVLTSWSLTEFDTVSELFIERIEPWNQESVTMSSGQTIEMNIIWKPTDSNIDRGQIVFEWDDLSVTVEINTSELGSDLIIAGEEMAGAEMAGTEMAGAEMAGSEMAGAEMAGAGMAGTDLIDTDLDGVSDSIDNCIQLSNPDQNDRDRDGQGDLCDPEPDRFGGVMSDHSVVVGIGRSTSDQFSLSSELTLSIGHSRSDQFELTSEISQ